MDPIDIITIAGTSTDYYALFDTNKFGKFACASTCTANRAD